MDPVRWLDANAQAPLGARELLQAAEPLAPLPPAARERLALEVARLAALPKASVLAPLSSKLLAGVGTALLAGATVYYASRAPRTAVAVPPAISAHLPVLEAAPRPPPTPLELPIQPFPEATRTARPSAISVKPADVTEAAYLERARALLVAQPAQALALANRHGQAFPRGKLGTEADVIAAQALARLGNSKAAAARANESLKRAHNSIYTEQLERIANDGTRAPPSRD